MRGNALKIIMIMVSILLLICSGCHLQKSNNSNEYDAEINNIYEFLKEYKASGKIDQYNPDNTISDIEESIDCKFADVQGFGSAVYVFKVDEHLSFAIVNIPYTTCTFIIDGETYSSYDL